MSKLKAGVNVTFARESVYFMWETDNNRLTVGRTYKVCKNFTNDDGLTCVINDLGQEWYMPDSCFDIPLAQFKSIEEFKDEELTNELLRRVRK